MGEQDADPAGGFASKPSLHVGKQLYSSLDSRRKVLEASRVRFSVEGDAGSGSTHLPSLVLKQVEIFPPSSARDSSYSEVRVDIIRTMPAQRERARL